MVPDPALSLVSPAYRTEQHVHAMIESVHRQTSPDWELVVVDNGPSEEMARIVGRYAAADPRVRLVRQVNRGMQPGVNAGATVARGRYIAVLNSDDLVLPEFCERMTALLDARPEVAAVACDAYLFDDADGTRLARTYLQAAGAARPDSRRPITLADLIDGPCPYYTAAIRREAWNEVGGYVADEPAIADLDLWLRLVSAGHTLVAMPEVLGLYRQSTESMSRGAQGVLAIEDARIAVVQRHAAASGRPEVVRAAWRALRRSRHRQAVVRARVALFDGDRTGARRFAADAVREVRSARSAAILLGLAIAPGAVARLYSAKLSAADALRRVRSTPDPIATALCPDGRAPDPS